MSSRVYSYYYYFYFKLGVYPFQIYLSHIKPFMPDLYRHISPAFCIPAVNAKSSNWSAPGSFGRTRPRSPLVSSFGDWLTDTSLRFYCYSPTAPTRLIDGRQQKSWHLLCSVFCPNPQNHPRPPTKLPGNPGKVVLAEGSNTNRNKSSRAGLPSSQSQDWLVIEKTSARDLCYLRNSNWYPVLGLFLMGLSYIKGFTQYTQFKEFSESLFSSYCLCNRVFVTLFFFKGNCFSYINVIQFS